MAVASPVFIASSPPQLSLRYLSTTPPSAQHLPHTSTRQSSSPKLPSPSTFVSRRPTNSKTGSRAQPAPEGAKLGFVSAGSLWRDLAGPVGENAEHDLLEVPTSRSKDERDDLKTTGKEITGKLKKPKKASRPALTCVPGNTARELALQDVYELPLQDTGAQSDATGNTGLLNGSVQKKAKKPGATGHDAAAKPRGRPRKKAEASAARKGDMATDRKKPSKRKAKSEAIILNSDDPELDAASTNRDQMMHEVPLSEKLPSEKPRSKRKEAAKPRTKKSEKSLGEIADPSDLERTQLRQGAEELDAPQRSAYFQKSEGRVKDAAISETGAASSVYFLKPTTGTGAHPEDLTSVLDLQSQVQDDAAPAEVDLHEVTVRRRRSWTPVRDTETTSLHHSRPPTAGSEVSDTHSEPKVSLAGIIGSFTYVPSEMPPPPIPTRTLSGEAVTKRRRVELVDTPTTDTVSRMDSKIAPAKPARKKAPKKKPQTITAVATAAFLPSESVETQAETVSTYFGSMIPAIQTTEAHVGTNNEMPPPAKKPRKPRKPKVKIIDDGKTSERQRPTSKAKKVAKSKKQQTTVKSNAVEPQPKLFSPERAVARIQYQSFLFGTSSQLAPAESAEFIRDMQVAVYESEQQYAGPDVFSSPMLASTQRLPSPQKKSSIKVPTAPHGTSLSVQQGNRELWSVGSRDLGGGLFAVPRGGLIDEELAPDDIEHTVGHAVCVEPPIPAVEAPPAADHSIIEVNTSPVVETIDVELPPGLLEQADHTKAEREDGVNEQDDDSWMMLSSDGPADLPARHQAKTLPIHPQTSQTSPARSPPPFLRPKHPTTPSSRRALHPLDSNLKFASHPILDKAVAFDQARTLTTTNSQDTAPKIVKLKRSESADPRSQPAPQSDWLDIDEIYDSESPSTPSPPRRRATSSPPEMPRLTLSPSKLRTDAPAPFAGHSLKPDGAQWPDVKAVLFSRISNRLKSAPRGTDASSLSWWDKILLYDPIVVEDLTEWLNEQGLCVQVKKKKTAAKTKKRKMPVEESAAAPETEFEICSEPLQPWMVQKWCEENSICCYLKKGSWRSGRTKT